MSIRLFRFSVVSMDAILRMMVFQARVSIAKFECRGLTFVSRVYVVTVIFGYRYGS